jgi:hypothetical protein
MITVNSLSGGKTSSYLEAHYPADVSLFALMCLDSHNANVGSKTFTIDSHIKQLVNDKLQKFCSHQPEFQGTAEDPLIIKTMLDLEQHTGREITWLRGADFGSLVDEKGTLPNKQHRWCTTKFKIKPVFEHLFMYHSLPCKMRIGYRSDEAHRVNNFRDTFKYATHAEFVYQSAGELAPRNMHQVPLPYITKSGKVNKDYIRGYSHPFRHRWAEIPFRIGEFPLIEDGIDQQDVQRYWKDKNVQFPEDSNCQFCFWKHPQQLRKNFETNPSIMNNAVIIEMMKDDKSTFHHQFSMADIRDKVALQGELFQMKGGSCQGGYCTE